MPVSTTHSITMSIMAVGAAKPRGGVDKVVAERIVWAWVLTIPCPGGLAYVLFRVLYLFLPA